MKKVLSVLAVAAAIVVLGCVTVFAVDSEAFGYLAGRQRSTARADLYAGAETLPEDEREEFLAENGIGEEPYSEEAAANYSYVGGQAVGSQYEDDTEDKTGYSYVTGQENGAAYSHTEDAEEIDESGYSFVTGQESSSTRSGLYEEAETLPEDEQDEFLAENGIGEEPYSEEAAANYSYVAGQSRGASYRRSDDSERAQDISGYSFVAGQQRGSSYQC